MRYVNKKTYHLCISDDEDMGVGIATARSSLRSGLCETKDRVTQKARVEISRSKLFLREAFFAGRALQWGQSLAR